MQPERPSLIARIAHALTKPARKARYKRFKAGLGNAGDARAVFSEIYEGNLWNDVESRSGAGSTMAYTAGIRAALEDLLKRRGIGAFLDAPCGDFHWMSAVPMPGVQYIGGDIVPALVAATAEKHADANRSFVTLDITRDPLPAADLWMCRDCLFHLSYADIARALQRFTESSIPLVLFTTYIVPPGGATFTNRNISTGDARPIDLRAPPFNFPEPVERFDDWVPPFTPREMGLWTREQLLPVAAAMKAQFLTPESR